MNDIDMQANTTTRCIKWKISGHIIGWLGIFLSVGYAAYMGSNFFLLSWKTLFLFFLNLAACVLWLCGIVYNKATCIHISLFYWTMLIGLRCGIIIEEIINSNGHYRFEHHLDSYAIAGFFLLFYIAAVMTYTHMDADLLKNSVELPQFNSPNAIPRDTYAMQTESKA